MLADKYSLCHLGIAYLAALQRGLRYSIVVSMSHSEGDIEKQLFEALEALHLPRMPMGSTDDSPHVLRILVVADVDLPSVSALAEFTLQQNNLVFDASMVDLCIACGSFARDEDLLPYLRGQQERRMKDRQSNNQHDSASSGAWTAAPFFRSREETAALEGLMTAALSQLESIVCRVVYCPGSEDPVTTLFTDRSRRLTPNSRNVHQQWLPLAPGIGCTALLYLDSFDAAIKSATSSRSRVSFDDDHDDLHDEYDDDEDDNPLPTWSEKLIQIHRR